jgi:hypothetical protein
MSASAIHRSQARIAPDVGGADSRALARSDCASPARGVPAEQRLDEQREPLFRLAEMTGDFLPAKTSARNTSQRMASLHLRHR